MDGTLLAVVAVGFALGLRHALDPDHIVAVSTIVSEHKSFRKSSLVGAFWGLGHTASLLAVGIIVIAFKRNIPERAAMWMELGVAVMLVVLGAKAVRKALRGWSLHVHEHTHDGRSHIHIHIHRHEEVHVHQHRHLFGFGTRPFLIGMIHGLAGSAALMILVLGTIPSAVAGLSYIAMFGLGSIGGMILMSSLVSIPFVFSAKRFSLFNAGLQFTAGLVSVAFGLFVFWQYGFQERLLY